MNEVPLGFRFCLSQRFNSLSSHRSLILFLTYLAYVSYHLSRRPFSIVKNVLIQNCTNTSVPKDCGWDPFNSKNSETLFGLLDSAFLFTYAFGMFVSGFVAERCNLRYFLAIGMLMSGLMTYALGLTYYYNIHSLWFFIIFQILSGFFQTTGWPSVVSCVGNWFDKSSRGLIFGIWNSHTNVGNILGAVIAGAFVDYNWGLSFIIPGVIIGIMGFAIFLYLIPYPQDVGFSSFDIYSRQPINCNETPTSSLHSSGNSTSGDLSSTQQRRKPQYISDEIENNQEESPLLRDTSIEGGTSEKNAISFFQALRIPGVLEFSVCLFFAKLVSYTFLFWLPFYIKSSMHSSSSDSAFLSISFDLGGIIGGIMAGYIVDRTGASALTCVFMLFGAIPSLFLYYQFGASSNFLNIILQTIAGAFVNGPYALITTAVSAELGTKVKSSQALATVTAIIDGTGSLGAAIGPLLSGPLARIGWNSVFIMVMLSDFLALLSLLRIAKQEWNRRRNNSSINI